MKSLVGQQSVTRKSSIGGLYSCAMGLDILKFEQTSLFYSASYFNGGAWSFVLEGLITSKPPWLQGCVAKLQLAFQCNWLGICDMSSLQDMSNFLFISMTGPKVAQCNHVVSVYFASWGKTCAGIILPSFEHSWLKWSCASQGCSAKKRGVGTNKEDGYTQWCV